MAPRRPREQIVAGIDAKIEYHSRHIARLNAQREKVLTPPERKQRTRKTGMKDARLTPDEILALAKKKAKAEANA